MNFINLFAAEGGVNVSNIIFWIILALFVVCIIVLPRFFNKRRQKEIDKLHDSVQVGAVVKTVGGIIGTVIEVRTISPVDKEMILETGVGDNKSTMVFDMQALYQVLSGGTAPVPSEDVFGRSEEKEGSEDKDSAETSSEQTQDAAPEEAAETSGESVSETPVEEKADKEESVDKDSSSGAESEVRAEESEKAAVTPPANSSDKVSFRKKK